MNDNQLAFFIWSVASALGVAAIGALSLGGGRGRPRGAWAFGLFTITWGVQIVAGALASIAETAAGSRFWSLTLLAFNLPLPYLLLEVAAAQSSVRPRARWPLVRVVAASVALLAGLLLVTVPGMMFQGVAPAGSGFAPLWGPLYAPLVVLPYFLSFGIVLVALAHAKAKAATPRLAHRATITLAGLGIVTTFAAANTAVFYTVAFFEFAPRPNFALFAAVSTATLVIALVIAARSFSTLRRAVTTEERRRESLLVLAILVPAVWGAIEAFLSLGPAPLLNTIGLWRLAGVAIIAYGIARWRIPDLPQRTTRAAATATGATAAVASGAAAYGAGSVATTSTAVPIVLGVLVLLAALAPAVSFARRLFGLDQQPRGSDMESILYGQRVDAYRAAVEASLARASLDEDREFLSALRERFEITTDEDRLITHLARSSVLVARSTRAWEAYERLRLLGEGGGGRTWLARDRARDRLVVLKEPLERWQQDPAARDIVLREARMAARVRHANVVAVEEVVEGKGSPIIVMEYLEGGSLRDLLRSKGALPWADAKALAHDVLRGLEAIHAAGIVHRDVKPNNILLNGEGIAKVADFGIAVAPETSGQRTMVIDPGHSTIAGTLHYMAPEARAGAPPDRRSDLYACGAVLHEMLYGAPPGLPSPTLLRPDLSPAVAALVARALAPDPHARPPTARAFADELDRI